MNQYHDLRSFSLTPDSSRTALESTLARLLVPGDLMDSFLKAHCRRLQKSFDTFCSTCPSPQWHQGLILTSEIRCQTEIYLPVADIRHAFRYLLLSSCRYKPFLAAVPIFSALSWPDALERINQPELSFNPARIIAEVAADQELRTKFLASLFVPKRYGNGFDRYPLQGIFLKEWLSSGSKESISVLDAACGSGEGVYGLAETVAEAGFHPGATVVHGCTIEPLELAAAAHGWFPQESLRERSVKGMIELARGKGGIRFFRDDICRISESPMQYDVVICNGLLGGPLLHDSNALEAAVNGLVQRVKKGGILLAADRFHAGWRRVIPLEVIDKLLSRCGVRVMRLTEGVGGIRT